MPAVSATSFQSIVLSGLSPAGSSYDASGWVDTLCTDFAIHKGPVFRAALPEAASYQEVAEEAAGLIDWLTFAVPEIALPEETGFQEIADSTADSVDPPGSASPMSPAPVSPKTTDSREIANVTAEPAANVGSRDTILVARVGDVEITVRSPNFLRHSDFHVHDSPRGRRPLATTCNPVDSPSLASPEAAFLGTRPVVDEATDPVDLPGSASPEAAFLTPSLSFVYTDAVMTYLPGSTEEAVEKLEKLLAQTTRELHQANAYIGTLSNAVDLQRARSNLNHLHASLKDVQNQMRNRAKTLIR